MPAGDPPRDLDVPYELLDELLGPFAMPGAPGASIGVFFRGEPLVQRAAGLAVVESQTRADVRTNFRLASLTKQFTAAAVLLLVERGALRLDAPVGAVLPELRDAGEPVRVHHLLSHTSGLWDYEELIPADHTEQVRDADVLALLSGCNRRYFSPGAAFRYSNSGYALLALLVERLGGCSFSDHLREEVFWPLGMRATLAYEAGRGDVPNRAYGYSADAERFARTDQSVTSAVLGDGGVYGSVAELARWEHALVHPNLLSRVVLERMWSQALLRDGTPVPYGCGWYVDVDRGRQRLTHHGETVGFRNAVIRYPQEQLAVWVLTNRNSGAPWDVAQRVADRVLARLEGTESSAPAARWPFHQFG